MAIVLGISWVLMGGVCGNGCENVKSSHTTQFGCYKVKWAHDMVVAMLVAGLFKSCCYLAGIKDSGLILWHSKMSFNKALNFLE